MRLQNRQVFQQKLILAPNVTLGLNVLRMTTQELQAFLSVQAEENPFLELEEPESSSLPDSRAEELPQQTQESAEAPADEPRVLEMGDWNPLSTTAREHLTNDPDDDLDPWSTERYAKPQSLSDWLLMQLGCQPIAATQRRLGEAIIHQIDEHGYLEGTLDELAAQLDVSLPELTEALRLIQRLDPPGVGARDLRECLMLQLEQAEASASLSYRILRDHFPLFARHRLGALARATRASQDAVSQACERITRLNPRPGRLFLGDLPPAIIPDLVIHRREQHYDVEINDAQMPRLMISRAYYRMLKNPETPVDAREFLANKFRQAGWVVKAIDERNATLLSISRCLISLQRDFLEHGPRAIQPLTQAQVAEVIGRHPSTVSRAIAGKTIDTPFGIFHLEQLFASSIPQDASSNGVSDAAIKSELLRLIESEDRARPLSDAALVHRLKTTRSISVARRTIAKYRTALNILPAHLRKRRA